MLDSECMLRQCACTVNPPRPASPSTEDLYLATPVYVIMKVVVKCLKPCPNTAPDPARSRPHARSVTASEPHGGNSGVNEPHNP